MRRQQSLTYITNKTGVYIYIYIFFVYLIFIFHPIVLDAREFILFILWMYYNYYTALLMQLLFPLLIFDEIFTFEKLFVLCRLESFPRFLEIHQCYGSAFLILLFCPIQSNLKLFIENLRVRKFLIPLTYGIGVPLLAYVCFLKYFIISYTSELPASA